jgi:hypothetical protein
MSPNSPFSRRAFLAGASAAAAGLATGTAATGTADAATPAAVGVDLHWLDGTPVLSTGATLGVPWPRGQVTRSTGFALTDGTGTRVPVQSWPLAYWPDGSLKWTGHAVDPGTTSATLHLAPGTPAVPAQPVTVTRDGDVIRLANGLLDVRIATGGATVIRSITRAGRLTAHDGQLVLRIQDEPDDDGDRAPRRTKWLGVVEHADVEQSGPVRAVVRLTGHHSVAGRVGGRRILPWRCGSTCTPERIPCAWCTISCGTPIRPPTSCAVSACGSPSR